MLHAERAQEYVFARLMGAVTLSVVVWAVYGVLCAVFGSRQKLNTPGPGQNPHGDPTASDVDTAVSKLTALCGEVCRGITDVFVQGKICDGLVPAEVFAFGMAVATETYELSVNDPAKARPILDRFHLVMGTSFGEQLLSEQKLRGNDSNVIAAHEHLMDLCRVRYPLYRQAYRADVRQPNSIWRQTSTLLLSYLPGERLPPPTIETFMVPIGLKAALCYVSGLKYFSDSPAFTYKE
jgi:hypothetical protein